MTTDPRLAQVRARDASADGAFVYAVRTTGVFCRPSCGSRPAKADNIVFYDDATVAAQAGYRPCRRCRPATAQPDHRALQMQSAARYIGQHADQPMSLARLAAHVGVSRFHLQRTFKGVFGVSPKEFHAALRIRAFKSKLRSGDRVLDAVVDSGYGSTSRLYEHIDGHLGMTPSAYRAGGAGEIISYAVRDTALGPLLMAATDRGVCMVTFGDAGAGAAAGPGAGADGAARSLESALRAEFPRAELRAAARDNGPLDAWLDALDAHLSRAAPRPDIPLDLKGTAFQIRVWRFLIHVKPGDVLSYSELAVGVGAPRAVRAAASACAANRIAVLIPCHRALRADGGLGGYRWGLERKRTLLDAERALDTARSP